MPRRMTLAFAALLGLVAVRTPLRHGGALGSDDRTSGVKPPGAAGGEGLNPGDQAEAGTPGSGENVCRACKASGQLNAKPCPTCGGIGKVVEGVGGG